MSEEDLLTAITAGTRSRPGLCKLLGIAWYHTRDSRKSPSGWPDLVLCGGKGLLFRELKSERGQPTIAQLGWGNILAASNQSWAVWRPADLASGRIAAELQAIR